MIRATGAGDALWGRDPFPIFCRGHSGGRLLCEAYIRNGIAMGDVTPDKKDTAWFVAANPKIRHLVLNAPAYSALPAKERDRWRERTRECISEYERDHVHRPGPFGWKMGFTLFMMPMVLDAFPGARVVHLIRDGRDVMLSRLDARMDFRSPLNRLAVFGDPAASSWRGAPLDANTVSAHRNELEMQHWVTAVTFGLQGRAYGDRYLEVRYEDVCADPLGQFERIFAFLDMPFLPATRAWLEKSVHCGRIGKWRRLPSEEVAPALSVGEDLLRRLGYL